MAAKLEVYKCMVCGNIVEVLHGGAGELVCCGEPMERLDEKTADAATEKHVPVIERIGSGVKVKVGSVEHPMEDKHYIKFIEILLKDRVMRKELKPGQAPEAECYTTKSDVIEVREFCTVHGLWKNK